ncbi:MAG: DUF4349 domain-containing protein [bacterium]|nr:DUF4349 domain-containing protein [bacterium]
MRFSIPPWKGIGIGAFLTVLIGTAGFFAYDYFLYSYEYDNYYSESGGYGADSLTSASLAEESRFAPSGSFETTVSKNSSGNGSASIGIPNPLPPIDPDQSGAVDIPQRQIIQTGRLSLIVADAEQTLLDMRNVVEKNQGFVTESKISEFLDDRHSAWMQARIPAPVFNAVLMEVKELAIEVESENVTADDVTRQVVDTEARLVNLRAQEEQFRKILNQAGTITEVLEVTREINRVREEIERIEAQLKNLTERVAFSTLTINLIDEGEVEIFGIYWTPLLSAKQAVRSMLEDLAYFVDSAVFIALKLPVVLAWAAVVMLLGWLGWRLGRWGWRRVRG